MPMLKITVGKSNYATKQGSRLLQVAMFTLDGYPMLCEWFLSPRALNRHMKYALSSGMLPEVRYACKRKRLTESGRLISN